MAKDTRTGAQRIADERQRQIEVKGWTPGHDDKHDEEEIAWAAACYAAPEPIFARRGRFHFDPWPWSEEWDKRTGPGATPDKRIRALEKAGALIAAEIDRLLRASGSDASESGTGGGK